MELLTQESYEVLRKKQQKPMLFGALCVLGMFLFGSVAVYLERNPLAYVAFVPAILFLFGAIAFIIYGMRFMLITEEAIVITDKVYLFGTQYRLKQEEGFTQPKMRYTGKNTGYRPSGARFVFTKSNVQSAVVEQVPTPYNFFDARVCLATNAMTAVHITFKTPLRDLYGGTGLTDLFVSVPDANAFITMLRA